MKKTQRQDPGIWQPGDGGQAALELVARALQASTVYSTVGLSRNGTILQWNEGARRLCGYTAPQVVGRANASLLHVEQAIHAGLPRRMLETAAQQGQWQGLIRCRRQDGCYFTAWTLVISRPWTNGQPAGFLMISRNVSSEPHPVQNRPTAPLNPRARRESNAEALLMIDLTGRITDVNPSMAALAACTRSEMTGQPFSQFFTPAAGAGDFLLRAQRDCHGLQEDWTLRGKDGRESLLVCTATLFHDDAGAPQGIFIEGVDITEYTPTENKIEGLLEMTADALIVVDDADRIALLNRQAGGLFGYRHDHLIDAPLEQLVPGWMDSRPARNVPRYGRHRNGKQFPLEITLSPMETESGARMTMTLRNVQSGARRLPLVASAVLAMKGDRERMLASRRDSA